MKIKAVALMREAREKLLRETAGMSWEEERVYLREHGALLHSFVKQEPNNGATSDRGLAGRRSRSGQPARGGVR